MLSISNWIFKPRMHTVCIRSYYPIGSPRGMMRSKILDISLWYSKQFSKLATKSCNSPIIYPAGVNSWPLPILERVLAGVSLFNQLLIMKETFNIRVMGS